MRGPVDALTAASNSANDVCAGGGHEDQTVCYAETRKEILAAQALQEALRSVPTPTRFAIANSHLLEGLDVMAQGLALRNQGLADRSSAKYQEGVDVINRSLDMQKSAFAEYPQDAGISA
jgi:hypothetical protein